MRRYHIDWLPDWLKNYAEERGIEYHRYSPYHMRLIYDPVAVLDIWTTGKYYAKETNYFHGIIERGGETGHIPKKGKHLKQWLDNYFFIIEIRDQKEHEKGEAL